MKPLSRRPHYEWRAFSYPEAIRDFLVGIERYALRVETYIGLLTDEYPPFRMAA